MDVSLGKLQQLVTVARTGSFSRAALELNISQPALSRSVAAIEESYGFRIFDRMGHGVQLTAAGAQVIELARPLLQTMRIFDNNLRLFGAGQAGTLSIGLAPLLASQLLARFAGEFFDWTDEARLEVMIRPGAVMLDGLKNDLIELFFFPEGYIEPDPEIDIEQVGWITPVYVVRSGHPLASRQDLTAEDLAEFPWASSVAPPIMTGVLNPARFVCDNYHILRDAVAGSDLVCISSSAFVAGQLADGTFCEIQVKDLPLPETAVYMAKHRGRVSSPLAAEAVVRIRRYFGTGSGAPGLRSD